MDISNNEEKGFKRVSMPMCDRKVPCDISNEFTMPDYKPEIRRILHVCPVISEAAKYISSTSAEFNGNIDYNVLYVGADGELHSMPFSSEYSFEAPIEAEGFDFNDEITSCCDTVAESINVRVLGPRKMSIKSRLNSSVRIFGRKFIDQNFDFDGTAEHIQTLEEIENNARVIRANCDNLEISDETFMSGANQGVAFANANVHVSSIRPMNDTALIDGEIVLKMICVDMDDTSKTNVITKKIPYSTELEADGILPESMCVAKGNVMDLAINVEDDRIICDMSVSLQLEAQNEEEVSLICDLYSTRYEGNCSFKTYNLPSVGYAENGNFSMNEKLSRESLALPENFEIVDLYGSALVEGCEITDGKAELRGTAKYTLILRCNDEYSSYDVALPIKYVFDCKNKNITSYSNEFNVINCVARYDGEILSIDAELGVVGTGYSSVEKSIVDNVKFLDEVNKSKGEITVVYPSTSDDLWAVAKRYHVSVGEIEEKNPSIATLGINAYIVV